MYCKKCGKQLDFDGDICKDCAENEAYFGSAQQSAPAQEAAPAVAPATPAPAPAQTAQPIAQDGDRKFGFGKALASTIMGAISNGMASIASGIPLGIELAIMELGYANGGAELALGGIAVTIIMALISIGLAIPALIMGIKSIKTFNERKNAGYVKPVATLVLGIIGVVCAGLALLSVLGALGGLSDLAAYL